MTLEELRPSVIIPCRDAAATLGRQLAAVAGQSWPGGFEVVVADNGSTDGSQDVARAFAGRLERLRMVDASVVPGAAHARNAGARAASGNVLLFCDADDEVAPGWLGAMGRALVDHALVAARFDLSALNPPWLADIHDHPQARGISPYTYPPFLPHAGGSGLGVRRDRHEAIGGFDESLPALEDTDYCWRMQLAGTALAAAPGAVIRVRYPATLGGAFRQARRFGRWNVALYRRYQDRGMPRLGLAPGLARWLRLLAGAGALARRRSRARWVWQLGWRLGRLEGCLRERVLAP